MADNSISGAMSYQASAAPISIKPAEQVKETVIKTEQVSGNIAADTITRIKDSGSQNNQTGQSGNDSGNSFASHDTLKKAVEDLNKKMGNSSANAEAVFDVHEKTNRLMIKIVDKDTKEVIKEYPPEKSLEMLAKVWEIAGILVDEKR